MLAFGDQVFLAISHLGSDKNFAFDLSILAERDNTVDFTNHCLLFGLADLKQFSHSWQTAGDVFGLGGLTWDLSKNIAGGDWILLGDHDNRAHRHEVTGGRPAYFGRLACIILDGNSWPYISFSVFHNHIAVLTGNRVNLILHGDTFHDITELHSTRNICENWSGKGIPLGQQSVIFHLLTIANFQFGTVDDLVAFTLSSPFAHNGDFSVAVHHHQVPVHVLHRTQVDVFHCALVAIADGGLLDTLAGRSTNMKGTHGKLGSRLTDGLSSDNADGCADLHHSTMGQITTIALYTGATPTAASQD